ncbi:MAG: hypothetical protein V1728_03485 [Candidatus Micrarchaeota archaeon]
MADKTGSSKPPPAANDSKAIIVILVAIVAVLILIPVLLIGGMVGIALLGFVPMSSVNSQISESTSYWQSARPFSVLDESRSSGSGDLTLVLQNSEPEQLQLTRISIGAAGVSGSTDLPNTQKFFSGGEKKAIQVPLSSGCTSGNVYEYYVNFTYSNADGTNADQKQYGAEPLAVTCR